MDISDPYCHTSTIAIRCSAGKAFDYLADGVKMGDWTLGSQQRQALGNGLFSGVSIFDGRTLYVRLHPDRERLMIYCDVGGDPEQLQPRNLLRIVPGPVVGDGADICLVTLMSWRSVGASDPDWIKLCSSHETEMFIIKDRLERTN